MIALSWATGILVYLVARPIGMGFSFPLTVMAVMLFPVLAN